MEQLIDLFLHIDVHLREIISQYGIWTYAILFLIIFCETGLVATPFLPGDSLLFAAGTFAAMGALDVGMLFFLLTGASILGDTTNYTVGHFIGPRVFTRESSFLLNKAHLIRAQQFYEKHGGKTIVIAKFMPIVRTFAPFVAGVGAMKYRRFIAFNVFGGAFWVSFFVFGGYFFGNLEFVKKHFSLVVVAIVAISLLPMAIEILRSRLRKSSPTPPGTEMLS